MIKRIAILGPESTGKTTLCKELATHFKTIWVPEYARTYISMLKVPYTLNDIEVISKTQIEQENQALLTANKYLFTDTELIMSKVWCEDVFKTCPRWMESQIQELKYDHYLLLMPDIPWKPDPVRENSTRRSYFFRLYQKELESRGLKYSIISGKNDLRSSLAVTIINKLAGK